MNKVPKYKNIIFNFQTFKYENIVRITLLQLSFVVSLVIYSLLNFYFKIYIQYKFITAV